MFLPIYCQLLVFLCYSSRIILNYLIFLLSLLPLLMILFPMLILLMMYILLTILILFLCWIISLLRICFCGSTLFVLADFSYVLFHCVKCFLCVLLQMVSLCGIIYMCCVGSYFTMFVDLPSLPDFYYYYPVPDFLASAIFLFFCVH